MERYKNSNWSLDEAMEDAFGEEEDDGKGPRGMKTGWEEEKLIQKLVVPEMELPPPSARSVWEKHRADKRTRIYKYDLFMTEDYEIPEWAAPDRKTFEYYNWTDVDVEPDDQEIMLMKTRVALEPTYHDLFSWGIFGEVLSRLPKVLEDWRKEAYELPLSAADEAYLSSRPAPLVRTTPAFVFIGGGMLSALGVKMFESMTNYLSVAYRLSVIESRIGLVDESGRPRPRSIPLMPKDGPLRVRLRALIPKPQYLLRAVFGPMLSNPTLPFAGAFERSVLYMPYQASKFTVYDSLQDYTATNDKRFNRFWSAFLGGSISGLVASALTHPLYIAEQQAVGAGASSLRFVEAGYVLYQAESWYSFFDGIRARMMYNGFLEGFSFGFYTFFRNRRQHQRDGFMKNFVSGTLAGACASTLMLPFDYINYRATYYWPPALDALSSEPVDEYAGTFDAWQKISAGKHGGYWGFMRRTVMRVARPAPIIGLQLALYEQAREWCRGLAQPREPPVGSLLPPLGPLETRELRPTSPAVVPSAESAPYAEPAVVVPYFSDSSSSQPASIQRSHLDGVFQLNPPEPVEAKEDAEELKA